MKITSTLFNLDRSNTGSVGIESTIGRTETYALVKLPGSSLVKLSCSQPLN